MSSSAYELFLWLPAVLFGLTIHEFAHALAADLLGDPTPRQLGRLTLNPLAHLDPVGSLLLVLVHFGWGKPVPVDPHRLGHPRRDLLLIALAGPLANLLSAVIFGLVLRAAGPDLLVLRTALFQVLNGLVVLSLVLAFFNLIPVPPLDGSRVLSGLLPGGLARWYQRLASPLSWGLLLAIALGSFTELRLLDPLVYFPVSWVYRLLVGPAFS